MTWCMGRKTDAYVDTSALIAFADRSDTHHALFKRLFSNPPRLVTTTLVVAEGHGWFLKRYDRTRALQFIALVEALSPMAVVAVGQEEQAGGFRMLRKFSDQDLTLTDAVGLHVMTASRIHTCWSTDRHLGLAGASLVTERNT
jgi:predicted nucleic acid-binding protein